jgi:RNA polymerase sigma-70 factor (ECF subfamily)
MIQRIENEDIQNKTDEELVELAKTSPDLYIFLVERYEDKILRYIGRITNYPKETVQDLGQEIFLKAYENINDFDSELKFSSWLYRIAHNHTISFWRKNKKAQGTISWDENESLKNIIESDEDLVRELDNKLVGDRIKDVLGLLKPIYKEVLVLKYIEGKDYQEISDIIKKPMGTVGTLILRAKKEFREKWTTNEKV